MKPTLVILAAGMGSRYGGLKQIDNLGPNGETLMEYAVFDALRAGFGKIVFVIRRSFERDFRDVFMNRLLAHIDYEIVFQELNMLPDGISYPQDRDKPWGTAHAVWVCRDVINKPFVVVNADDFYGREAYENLAFFLGEDNVINQKCYAMNAYRLGNTLSEFGAVARGICKISSDNFLQKVEEHHGISKDQMGNNVSHLKEGRVILADDEPVSMNIWAFLPSVFKHLEEYLREFMLNLTDNKKEEAYIPAFVDYLVRNNIAKVKVYQSGAEWFGVTYAQDKPQVMQKLSILTDENQYPSHLFF